MTPPENMQGFWKSAHQTVDKITGGRIKNASRSPSGPL
jgi:hypothetical protein